MEQLLKVLESFGGTVIAIIAVTIAYLVANKLLREKINSSSSYVTIRRIVMASIFIIGAMVIVTVLPISNELRGQLISFFGVIISAGVVLSSTTLLGNALSALMMRFIDSFQVGDFIETEDVFGRVTNRGMFHTEVQTVDRDLMTIPNLHLATHPVKVIRASGTIISAEVSLGYDVPRTKIEAALVKAAEETGLSDPFVFVTSLGDYSVVYKLHGLLSDTSTLVSTRSRLRKLMLDQLHKDGIEIVSPNFMNQRQIGDQVFIPKKMRIKEKEEQSVEHILFDKAELATELENSQLKLDEVEAKCLELEKECKGNPDDAVLQKRLEVYHNFRDKMRLKVQEGQDKFEKE